MPLTRTRAVLRSRSREIADAENDRNIGDTLLNGWIDDAVAEVWRLKVNIDGDTYAVRTTLSTSAGTQNVSLPADFMLLRRLDKQEGSTLRQLVDAPPLLELDFTNTRGEAQFYRVIGGGAAGASSLWILPDPGTATYVLWYIQSPQALANDAATMDCTYGEDEYITNTVATKIANRQDRDPMPYARRAAAALESIATTLRKRATGRPTRITDVRFTRTTHRRYPLP